MKNLILAIYILIAVFACSTTSNKNDVQKDINNSLKNAYAGKFLVGAALNGGQILGRDQQSVKLVIEQFNSITPENIFKPGPIHPKPTVFNFELPDKYVEFGLKNKMFIIGHTLVWHSQVPDWLFVQSDGTPVSSDSLRSRMENHIKSVVGRYKGKVNGWDVVNEALNDDGTYRESPWLKIMGESYLFDAYSYAKQTDPEAELYYNDYNLWKADKCGGAIRLVRSLKEKGIAIDGVGMQGHYGIDYPTIDQIENSIIRLSNEGLKVMITELDIDILPNPSGRQGADIGDRVEDKDGFNPYPEGLPDSLETKLANRYKAIFELFNKHSDKITRVTFWGVSDKDSWLNNWPMNGRTNYPLLFDRKLQEKPAYNAVISVALDNK